MQSDEVGDVPMLVNSSPVPGVNLSGNLSLLLDILLRYGLGTVLAMFLVWNMVSQSQVNDQRAAEQHQQIIQMLVENQRNQADIAKTLERVNGSIK